jgi:hypothetical protein
MALWVTRESRSVIALAMASMGLVACSSGSPTAPSASSANGPAVHAEIPSASPASLSTGNVQATGADTIKITQGTLALESGLPGTVTLKGSRGFRFDGRIQSGNEPSNYCGPFGPCQPGATVQFAATWVGSDIPGTARVQGDEFDIQGLDGTSMYIDMNGSFVAPAHLADTASVTVPFAATGLLLRGYPLPSLQLTGRGHVTFRLEWQPFIGGWAIRYSSFDFGGGSGHAD